MTESECDFGEMNGCKLDSLSLWGSGNRKYSDWENNVDKLFNIMAGVEKCENLRNSLTEISPGYSSFINMSENFEPEIKNRYPLLINIKIHGAY